MESKMSELTKPFTTTVKYIDLLSWDVKNYMPQSSEFNKKHPFVLFGSFLKKANISKVKIEDKVEYKILGVRSYGKGAYVNRVVMGKSLKMREYQQAKSDHLFWCKVDTKNGAFGIITKDLADGVASSNMTFAEIDTQKVDRKFLQILFTNKGVMQYLDSFVTGTTNRKYIRPDQLLNEIKIPLPSIKEQRRIVNAYNEKIELAKKLEEKVEYLDSEIEKYLFEELGLEQNKAETKNKGLQFIPFNEISEWGIDKIKTIGKNSISIFKSNPVSKFSIDVFRGKSPIYKEYSPSFMLNQKCNRWNFLDLTFAKNVDNKWFESIEEKFFTREGDILINSTGEGTIGRATYIKNEYQRLLYDSHMLLLRINKNILNPELFVELFNSSYGQNQVNDIKSAQATKQTELGVNNLLRIMMPIPDSLSFQDELVNKIRYHRLRLSDIKKQAEINRATAEQEFEKEIFGV